MIWGHFGFYKLDTLEQSVPCFHFDYSGVISKTLQKTFVDVSLSKKATTKLSLYFEISSTSILL